MKGRKMPNWVYSNITINGKSEDLIAFRDKAGKPQPRGFKDGVLEYEEGDDKVLSFWSFAQPTDVEAYFASSSGEKPEGYAEWDLSKKMEHDLKFTGNGWYDWNVREWGTKWDACDSDLQDFTKDKGPYLYYSFSTAWSIPEPVFRAMCEQHPDLDFKFWSEEEQGWGAEYTSSGVDGAEDGEPTSTLLLVNEWDIPNSHQDYVDRGVEENCNCQDGDDDQEYWYEDCPRDDQTFAVVVQQTFMVKAQSAEKAWELADEKMSGVVFDLGEQIAQADETTLFVHDIETNERLFPKTEESSH